MRICQSCGMLRNNNPQMSEEINNPDAEHSSKMYKDVHF